MKKLLRITENSQWELEGIEFAIKERVGLPENFIGRVEELEYLYKWASNITREISRSIAFLGRRKIGKSLILERLYNILYSEQKGLIPFYYEFTEGERSGKDFCHEFVTRFYMQVVGYFTRDIGLIREAVDKEKKAMHIEELIQEIGSLSIPYKDQIIRRLHNNVTLLNKEYPPYEYIISAVAAPDGFAKMVDVKDRVVQMIDEFQYLNMYIDAGIEDKPCKAYMSTAESRQAPLLITGSLMGVVSEELMLWLPQRFSERIVPNMKADETISMTMNYGRLYDHAMTPEVAGYIAYVTNNVPGRIVELVTPAIGKPHIASFDDVDRALAFEVGNSGNIKHDWDEYLVLAMNAVNDVNMRRITFFLCKHEGTWFYPGELKQAMGLELEDARLREELALLHKYDIIELQGGRYGGVFDRTLKKVLMTNYGEIFELPMEEFDAYFKNDNMLDYLKERVERLELSLEDTERIRQKLRVLQGEHNDLKGHYYEREVLLSLIQRIIDGKGGLLDGIRVTAFTPTLNYHLETGEEIDVVLEGEQVVVMVECKNYAPQYLYKITQQMVDEFIDKAHRLHSRFPDKELRLAFAGKHGLEASLEAYLIQQGIAVSW
ncbi:MAG: hypothetical protein GY801_52630 [bacterium]|nr:hypothetical protein [bacterium]